MNIAKFSLSKQHFIVVITLLLSAFGVISFTKIPRAEDPGFLIRNAIVLTSLRGASPERVDMLVTEKIERLIQEMPEVEEILSESKQGLSVINVKIWDKYTNMREIWDKLRRKVGDAEQLLPKEASKPIVNDEYGDVFGLIYGIQINSNLDYSYVNELLKELKRRLLLMDGIGKVEIEGMQDERVFIEYNHSKISNLKLTHSDIIKAINSKNIIKSGGTINSDESSILLELNGSFESIEDIQNVIISVGKEKGVVRLKDIANIYRGYIDPSVMKTRFKGVPTMSINISMAHGGNIINMDKLVDNEVNNFLVQNIVEGLHIEKIWSQAFIVKGLIDNFVSTLIQSIIIVCVVLMIFLGSRIGLLVSMMIPIIVLAVMAFIPFFGVTLNQVSLAALIVALGMLVDNSVVIAESIIVKSKKTKDLYRSIVDTVAELKLPLFISTTVVVSAFLPIYLAPSQLGEYTGELFIVIAICLYFSLCMSMTFVPVMSSAIIKISNDEQDKLDGKFYTVYRNFISFLLINKKSFFLLIVIFVALGFFCFSFINKKFLPSSDMEFFTAEIELPRYSSFRCLEKKIDGVERYIKENMMVKNDNQSRNEGVIDWVTYLGHGGPRYRLVHDPEIASINYSFMFFKASKPKYVDTLIGQLSGYLHDNYPDAKIKIRKLEMGSPIKHPIEIRVYGHDLNKLTAIINKIKSKLESIKGTTNVADDFGQLGEKIIVNINDFVANNSDITTEDIANSIESSLNGVYVGDFRERDKLIPIVLKSDIGDKNPFILSRDHRVYSKNNSFSLSKVADLRSVWSPAVILRSNGYRYIQAVAELKDGFSAYDINKEIEPWLNNLANEEFPPGYRWEFQGEYIASYQAMQALGIFLPLSLMIIFFFLMLQFNCIRRVCVIASIFPIGLIGAIFGLLITKSYFGFMTMVGVIALAGILFNNAIVLIDKIDLDSQSMPVSDAIIFAAASRVRPIFLTATSTVLGMLPLWLFGSILFTPLAIVIVFGLTFGICVTLVFLPVIFAVFLNVDTSNLIANDTQAEGIKK